LEAGELCGVYVPVKNLLKLDFVSFLIQKKWTQKDFSSIFQLKKLITPNLT
jgi:hypothetical protein